MNDAVQPGVDDRRAWYQMMQSPAQATTKAAAMLAATKYDEIGALLHGYEGVGSAVARPALAACSASI
jgi:hypothetical protein